MAQDADYYEKESERLLYHLSRLPQEVSNSSFEVSAKRGHVEACNLKTLPEFAIDILKLEKNTVIDYTISNRPILFKPTLGNCNIVHIEKGKRKEQKIDKFNTYELGPKTQFSVYTNGIDCEIVLISGEEKDD